MKTETSIKGIQKILKEEWRNIIQELRKQQGNLIVGNSHIARNLKREKKQSKEKNILSQQLEDDF